MSTTKLTAVLLNEDLVTAQRKLSPRWYIYFRDQDLSGSQGPNRIGTATNSDQSAAIVTTSMPTTVTLSTGLYRMTYAAQITTADGVSSSLQVTFGWTSRTGVSQSHSFTAITGNTTTTNDSQTWEFYSSQEPATPITYAAAYASNTPGAMHYDLYVTLESMDV